MPTKNQKNILIVGGAGYIGSHMVLCAQRAGYTPIVYDNLLTGHRSALGNVAFIEGDIRNVALLEEVFAKYAIAAVMHFGAFIQVGESVIDPAKYYENNFVGSLCLLQAMLKAQVKHLVFSSTAAVYGEPQYTPIDEQHRIAPINPYGHTKSMIEQVLKDYAKSYGLRYAALRYFNAAGADPEARLCENHEPETHLIPLVLQVASGKRETITVYGNDYETVDGTCLRDYIHVQDLCEAHLLALDALWQDKTSCAYNLGTGMGYTVKQVIKAAELVTQRKIPVNWGARRPGDPAILIADASLARKELKWQPKYAALETIIDHAWKSMKAQSVRSQAETNY